MFSPKDRENRGGELNRFDDSGEVMIMVICLCCGIKTRRGGKNQLTSKRHTNVFSPLHFYFFFLRFLFDPPAHTHTLPHLLH